MYHACCGCSKRIQDFGTLLYIAGTRFLQKHGCGLWCAAVLGADCLRLHVRLTLPASGFGNQVLLSGALLCVPA